MTNNKTSIPLLKTEIDLKLRIKEVAKKNGLMVKEVSERVGVNPTYITNIDKGRINTTIDLLQRIADAIDVPVHELIELPKGYGHFYVEGVWQGIRKV